MRKIILISILVAFLSGCHYSTKPIEVNSLEGLIQELKTKQNKKLLRALDLLCIYFVFDKVEHRCIGEMDIETVLIQLANKQDDKKVKQRLIYLLTFVGGDKSVRFLKELAKDDKKDFEIRRLSVAAIGGINTIESEKTIIELQNEISDVKLKKAIGEVFYIYGCDDKTKCKAEKILRNLAFSDREERYKAIKEMSFLEPHYPEFLYLKRHNVEQGILPLLKIKDDEIVDSVLGALYNLGSEKTIPEIIKVIENKDYSLSVKITAIISLGHIRTNGGEEKLKELLLSEDESIRRIAALAISKYGKKNQKAIQALSELLKEDADPEFNYPIVETALAYMGNNAGITELLKYLDDSSFLVDRNEIINALGHLKEQKEKIIPVLLAALEKHFQKEKPKNLFELSLSYGMGYYRPHPSLWALKRLTGKMFLNLEEWREWWEKEKRKR